MNYSIIFRKKYTFNDIIKYSKINGPTMFLLLWTIYQSYYYSKGFVIQQFFKLIRILTPINNQINNFKKDMANTFQQSPLTLYKIPNEGMNEKQIFNLINNLPKSKQDWKLGKISGTVYDGNNILSTLVNKVMTLYQWSNPLHPDLFPQIRQMEAEIVSFCLDLYKGKEDHCGTVTTGGTESIILACKTYRDYYKDRKGISNPEIIAPISVHVAFDKACHYLGIKLIKVKVNNNGIPLVSNIEKKINSQTICIVGSAPSFPHGVIDPLEEMGKLALKYDVGLHMDACLGGFVLPFLENNKYNFNINGLSSISLDTHKYGYGPKGGSVILYKSYDLIHYQYHVVTNWPGGIYISPSIPGSRSGAIIAGTWTSLLFHGKDGYRNKVNEIIELRDEIIDGLQDIPEIEIVGKPETTIVSIKCSNIIPENNIYSIHQHLTEKGWNLNSLQDPPALHICLTAIHCQQTEDLGKLFVKDINEALQFVRLNPNYEVTGMASIYGTTQSIPDKSIVKDLSYYYQDLYYKLN